jgi:hypothetical protein
LKLKVNHKQTYFDVTSKSKANLAFKASQLQNYDFSNSLSKSVNSHSFGLTTKVNNKREGSAKVTHAVRWWDNEWKFKYGLEVESKKEVVYSGTANLEKKRSLQNKEGWLRVVSNYSDTVGVGMTFKSNLKRKL